MVLPAILYLVFAASFVLLTYLMGVATSSDMYFAAMVPFEETPWQRTPHKTMYDVKNGPEVYEWISKVFVPQIYREALGPLDTGYCNHDSKCLLGQGNVDSNAGCAGGRGELVAGSNNCASYMGKGRSCCEACTGNDTTCPDVGSIRTLRGDIAFKPKSFQSLSLNCRTSSQPWLQDLAVWTRPSYSSRRLDTADNADPPSDYYTYCPERFSAVDSDINTRQASLQKPVMLADYNRVVLGRLTLKRVKLVSHTSKAFQNAYPLVPTVVRTSSFRSNKANENTTTFGPANKQYEYQQDMGFNQAGGFVQYLDFANSKDQILQQLATLRDNDWFDLYQGSFVAELLLYNGNVNKFLYVAFTFEHDFSGKTVVSIIANPLDLSMHDPRSPTSWLRFILYLIIILLFVFFVKVEFEDMSADPSTYFSDVISVMHAVSLFLVGYCIVLYLTVVVSYSYLHFSFPMANDMNARIGQFQDLASLSGRVADFITLVSVNICLIFIRCIAVVTTLAPTTAIVFNTISEAKYSLMSFCIMFGIIFLGFTFAGYFLFGTRMQEYSTVIKAILSTIKLIMGDSTFPDLDIADGDMATVYFMVFQILFLIVSQILLSIVIQGHKKEKERLTSLDRYPLQRFWRLFKTWLREYSSWLNRCWVPLQQFVFGSQGGGTARVNYELVSQLRDRRATKPRERIVQYEQKEDDQEHDSLAVAKDVKLRAVMSFYPDGMMNYYVEEVTKGGPAEDANVLPGYRLVGVSQQGTFDRDHEKFRDKQYFEKCKTTRRMLEQMKKLPVRLKFEGPVKPVSWECVGLMCFIAIFLSFIMQVSRVSDSFSQVDIHYSALLDTQWSGGSSFENITSMADVADWLAAAVVGKEYGCAASSDGALSCNDTLNGQVRNGWFLWQGEGVDVLPYSVTQKDTSKMQPLNFTPVAAKGLSLGFIPFPQSTVPATQQVTSEVVQVVNMNHYNVGVMPNNHVRVTFQIPCFQRNDNPRWEPGYQYELDPSMKGSAGCAEQPCMQEMKNSGRQCLNQHGEERNASVLNGPWSTLNYTYYDSNPEGTYSQLGGIAVGLGNTQREAKIALEVLRKDNIFASAAVSAVVEFATYNANFDMFTYTRATFSLKSTGRLDKGMTTAVFPLNIFSMGSTKEARQLNWVLFVAYIVAALGFTIHLGRDLYTQYHITAAYLRPFYMFLPDFFVEDWWNIVDIVSVALNFAVVERLCRFMLIGSNLGISTGVRTWTSGYHFTTSASLNAGDGFQEFEYAATLYQDFSGLAAINGLFLMVRFLKYFGGLASLRLVLTTLSNAINELLGIIAVFTIMILGFVFAFFSQFGIRFARFGTVDESFVQLFLLLVSKFDVNDLIDHSPAFFVLVFPIFQVFFFLLVNMMLASLVFRWRATRRDAQEFSLRSTWYALKESLALPFIPQASQGKEEDTNMEKLDLSFWQGLSILRHIHNLDDSGRINLPRSEPHALAKHKSDGGEEGKHGDRGDDVGEEPGSELVEQEETGIGFNFDNEEDRKKFLKAFKKAHMELASQMCRAVPMSRDSGRGVALDDAEDVEGSERDGTPQLEDDKPADDDKYPVGIIEELQPKDKLKEIRDILDSQLQEAASVSEEIWLDALLTVLEEARSVQQLQKLFLPPPMIRPKNPKEWKNFNQKKGKMELRLNLFLKWLQEEARTRHAEYLSKMAESKERVLKQQSLVLTDYLETLDNQIEKLQEEIKTLERKNAQMRAPISPMLA